DAVLPLPPRLDGAAQRGFAQALRDADGDVEVAGRERAQLAAVRGVQVDRGDDQDAAHGLKRGTRNIRTKVDPPVPRSAFRLPRSCGLARLIIFAPLGPLAQAG